MTEGDPTNSILEDQNNINEALGERIGEIAMKHRLAKQAQQESRQVFQGKNLLNPDRIPFFSRRSGFFSKSLDCMKTGDAIFSMCAWLLMTFSLKTYLRNWKG